MRLDWRAIEDANILGVQLQLFRIDIYIQATERAHTRVRFQRGCVSAWLHMRQPNVVVVRG